MKKAFILICVLFVSKISFSQCFEGKIIDSKNNPIPYATIFCEKLSRGTTSNIEGYFKLDLPQGEHQIVIRYLGYKTKELTIKCPTNSNNLEIVLQEQLYKIPEVRILASGEDPAYSIMRKAVALSYYYLNQVEEYTCRIYLKGSGKLIKAPKMLEKSLEKDGLQVGNNIITENITDLHFRLPNIVEEKVVSIRSTIESQELTPMSYVTLSLYHDINGIVSPLGKNAFNSYKFQLASSFYDQDYLIHKIKVIPRREGFEFYSGYIFIVEGFWHLHSADLKLEQKMFTLKLRQVYSPVDSVVWMPVSHDFDIVVKAMGVIFEYKYVASVSDFKVKLNTALNHEMYKSLLTESKEEALKEQNIFENEQTRIRELTQKEDLTKTESKKLKKLVKKDVEKTIPPKDLEIKDFYTMDDSAKLKTVSYWDSIRPIPLTLGEKISYEKKDSIDLIMEKTPHYLDSLKKGDFVFSRKKFLLGGTYTFNEDHSFYNSGLFGLRNYSYNTVDGFKYHARFNYKYENNQGKQFTIDHVAAYAFARERMTSYLESKFRFNGFKRSSIIAEGGRKTADFNELNGIPDNLNLITTLFLKENHQKLFQKDYIVLGFETDIVNGLQFSAKFEYADRKSLDNHSSFYLLNPYSKEFTPNFPQIDNFNLDLTKNHQASLVTLNLSYTPQYFYKIKRGYKEMQHSRYPTVGLNYKQGINNLFGSDVKFNQAEATIKQAISTQRLGSISYQFIGGTFLNTDKLYFADYKHFATNKPFFISASDNSSFRLLNYYEKSTSKNYFEGHLQLSSNRILLKRLPLLNKTLISENIYINYLASQGNKPFYEAGYGLNQIFLLFNVEAFVGFEGASYKYCGIKIGIPFLSKGNDSMTIRIN